MDTSGSPRPPLQPQPPGRADAADLNSPSALAALSRFEFETAKGNEGTKVLMVEWDSLGTSRDNTVLASNDGEWEVSWEGRTTYLPTKDNDVGNQRRIYFLLPPGAPIPPSVTISQAHGPKLVTKPLPAIFPIGLGLSGHDAGKRGVLHTMWAKKRLLELQLEIASEMQANGESVGLEMALQEREWIADHFGVGDTSNVPNLQALPSPMSPRSPGTSRLGEKLKGLKLATSPAELATSSAGKMGVTSYVPSSLSY
jgi:hypothetical protein